MSSFKKKKFDGEEFEFQVKESPTDEGKEKKDDKKEKPAVESVGMGELFKFSDTTDKVLLFVGLVMAALCGGGFPLMFLVFGDIANTLNSRAGGMDDDTFMKAIVDFTWKMSSIGGGIWFTHYVFVACLNYTAERQVLRIRREFFRSVLRQEVGWYDTTNTGDFASRLTEDLNKMQDGMGEKMGMILKFLITGVASFIVPFINNWLLSAVLTAIVPVMIIMGGVMGKVMTTASKSEMDTYAKAGSIAEEVLSGVRTVVAFGGEKQEVEKYSGELKDAKRQSMLKTTLTMATMGLMFGIIYAAYGVGLWYGCKLIMDHRDKEEYGTCVTGCMVNDDESNPEYDFECIQNCDRFTVGSVTTAVFGILNGGLQVGQSGTYVEAFGTARAAAVQVFRVIDRVSPIDSSSTAGAKPDSCQGQISFKGVCFNYPARPDVQILSSFSLEVDAGTTVALVGASGCGKSTCVQLVQRLYDPSEGSVSLDGQDVRNLNVGWLRDQIGIVGQEPVLFDCSIRDNILYAKNDATEEEIESACKQANAFDFIQKLPLKLDTMVGEGGAQLSGGQKQRIAIARALIRDPQVLLLDEATSALDNESEAVVQAALDKIHSGRTTIVIAHRLTTVRNADLIVAVEKGQVQEMGTHDQLMKQGGVYYSLVQRQVAGKEEVMHGGEGKEDRDESKEARDKVDRQVSRQVSVKKEKKTEDEEGKKQSQFTLMRRLMGLNSKEWPYILVGVIVSVGWGALSPYFGFLFGDVMGVFAETDTNKAREDMKWYALQFGGIGLAFLFIMTVQGASFAVAGGRLVERVRKMMFASMLQQEIGWHDREENNTGALCARLSANAEAIATATGFKIGQVIQGISILGLSGAMALYYEWRLGLVTLAFIPPLVLGMAFQMRLMMVDGPVAKKALEGSAKVAVESMGNIRTVAGLRCEDKLFDMYSEKLGQAVKNGKSRSHLRGLIYGFANSGFMFSYAVCYYYGSWLMVHSDNPPSMEEVWKVVIAVINGGAMIGISITALMDVNKGFAAAENIFELLDRKPSITTNHAVGLKLNEVQGNTVIEEGEFSYPTRPDIKILRKLNLEIKAGQKVALVGQSGCGKSTVISLIQRFYDLDTGSLTIEDHNIQSLNVPFVRAKLGIVSQEPVLFNKSIGDNIRYGDNTREVTMEEVIKAARKANIHEFVSALPEGYETNVGAKGTQLSGGQKQRVAIARAMVRDPAVLLLDEATSALDTESEKVVQEALEAAQEGRTSITIAHRLSTIKDCDKIFVVERGAVAESGTHSELLARKGVYYGLWNRSTTG